MNYAELNGETIQEAFLKYDSENPKVYEYFCKYAQQVLDKGIRKYSSKLILGRVRWHLSFDLKGEYEYKINDAFTSRYARKFAFDHPEHENFFNFRGLRSM